jgi:hypothetical protein
MGGTVAVPRDFLLLRRRLAARLGPTAARLLALFEDEASFDRLLPLLLRPLVREGVAPGAVPAGGPEAGRPVI